MTFAMVGKALTIATKFECDAKGLVNFIEIKNAKKNYISDADFEQLLQRMVSYQSLDTQLKKIGFSGDLKGDLTTAKNSRNHVAHVLTLSMEITSDSEKCFETLIKDLKLHILNIAKGERLLLLMTCLLNKEDFPTKAYFESYPKKIVQWVTNK
jgi:hypothetical protein